MQPGLKGGIGIFLGKIKKVKFNGYPEKGGVRFLGQLVVNLPVLDFLPFHKNAVLYQQKFISLNPFNGVAGGK